ncbi:MAG: hypothetical protein IJU50_10755 [Lachnospiraceae bacterium]|nr:hypothetical protein [Lachnospiraceae bacterium]
MGFLEIILLLMGIAVFIAGYVFPEKKDKLNEDQRRMLKDEVAKLAGEEMAEARKKIGEAIEESVGIAMEKSERGLERISNEKVLGLSEYADNVLSDIKKNHDEVVFMYDMLSGKHEDLKETAIAVDKASRQAREMALDAKATAEDARNALLEGSQEITAQQDGKKEEPKPIMPMPVPVMPMPAPAMPAPAIQVEVIRTDVIEKTDAETSPGMGAGSLSEAPSIEGDGQMETERPEEAPAELEPGMLEEPASEAEPWPEETENADSEEEVIPEETEESQPKRGRGRPRSQKTQAKGQGAVQDISALLSGVGKKKNAGASSGNGMPGVLSGGVVSGFSGGNAAPNADSGKSGTFSSSDAADGIQENSNARILALHERGKSPVSIAKELGLGVGEVQLVIGLYEGRR